MAPLLASAHTRTTTGPAVSGHHKYHMGNEMVNYTIYTERDSEGCARYTLVDSDRNSIIIITRSKSLVDWIVLRGLRTVVPQSKSTSVVEVKRTV